MPEQQKKKKKNRSKATAADSADDPKAVIDTMTTRERKDCMQSATYSSSILRYSKGKDCFGAS